MPNRLKTFASASPLRIGLLGGSFNPSHAGHVAISLHALKQLKLDAVWWIVSPSNPLKDPATLAPFDVRVALAADIIRPHRRLHLCLHEEAWQLRYTHATLAKIKTHYPQHQFIWLMGADNLQGFHRWQRWQDIATLMPIAVCDRAPCTYASIHARFAVRFGRFRTSPEKLRNTPPPAWSMVFLRRRPESATHLRKSLGMDAFLGHTVQHQCKTGKQPKESVLSTRNIRIQAR